MRNGRARTEPPAAKLLDTHRMTIRLFNTLSNTVEDLEPSDGETLRMYVCGPTVYDYGHIGNFRTFLQLDVLRRFLKQEGRKLLQVMNLSLIHI